MAAKALDNRRADAILDAVDEEPARSLVGGSQSCDGGIPALSARFEYHGERTQKGNPAMSRSSTGGGSPGPKFVN
jgi:hypothetical protein